MATIAFASKCRGSGGLIRLSRETACELDWKGGRLKRVLIANRGEIAVRVIRGCRERGLETVAVYTEPDSGAPHVELADQAVCLEGKGPLQGYLSIDLILDAAASTGSDAIHPGYGFLSENAEFAEAVEEAGVTFIGPTGDTIRKMGSKTAARALMEAAGVPVVPGYQGDCTKVETVQKEAERIGYPVLVKAAVVGERDVWWRVQTDSRKHFSPPHEKRLLPLETDLFSSRMWRTVPCGGSDSGDGNATFTGERECSVQRRHQNVIEKPLQTAFGGSSSRVPAGVALRRRELSGCGDRGIPGTRTGEFYFLEMIRACRCASGDRIRSPTRPCSSAIGYCSTG